MTYSLLTTSNPVTGHQLWRTDGGQPEALMDPVAKLGDLRSLPNGNAVFIVNRSEVWATDGTAAGTQRLAQSETPHGEAMVLGTLADGRLAVGFSGLSAAEVWVTDGTAAGTERLQNAALDGLVSVSGSLGQLADGRMLFVAVDESHGRELWVTDGTAAGTQLVKDINTAGDALSGTDIIATFDGRVVFAADDGSHGRELWISDGTEAGTFLLVEANPGAGRSGLYQAQLMDDGRLIISSARVPVADYVVEGSDLWITDGSVAVTVRLYTGTTDYAPGLLGALGDGRLLLTAKDATHGIELWVTDGTAAGTALVKDIRPGASHSFASHVATLGDGRVLLSAYDSSSGVELWVTDGSAAGTSLLSIYSGVASANPSLLGTLADGRVLLRAADSRGYELWVTDGSAAGTTLVRDINSGVSDGLSSTAFRGTLDDGRIVFLANNATSGSELWVSDGTVAGTQMLKDINPGAAASNAGMLTELADGTRVFTATVGGEVQLWRTDGTAAGTQAIGDWSAVGNVGGSSGTWGDVLWLSDGRIAWWANDGSHGTELWISDGTESGSHMIKDINPGAASSWLSYWGGIVGLQEMADGRLLFAADDGTHGKELWVSDGTEAGTTLLKDIRATADAFYPSGLGTLADGRVLFSANDGTHGTELWVTNGTLAGTTLVKDITAGSASSYLMGMGQLADGRYLFSVDIGLPDAELWVTDGTTAGTQLFTASGGWVIGSLPDGRTLFWADADDGGTGLWVTDGSPAGTTLVSDAIPAANYGYAVQEQQLPDGRWLLGTNSVAGFEFWLTDGSAAGTALLVALSAEGLGYSPHLGGSLALANGHVLFTVTYDEYLSGTYVIDIDNASVQALEDVLPELSSGYFPYTYTEPGAAAPAYVLIDDGGVIWAVDGTAAGTTALLRETYVEVAVPLANGDVFLFGDNSLYGVSAWVTDGTAAGTRLLQAFGDTAYIGVGPHDLSADGMQLALTFTRPAVGDETWIYNGHSGELALLTDSNTQPATQAGNTITGDAVPITLNAAPTGSAQALAAIEDTPLLFTAAQLVAGFTDPEGGALRVSDVTLAAGLGVLHDNGNGTWTYTPPADAVGSEAQLGYQLSDVRGAQLQVTRVIELANTAEFGSGGDDVMTATALRETLFGMAGDDTLTGAGRDWLDGGDGSDVLRGGKKNDSLYGGAGDDALFGNAGADRLSGDAGNDTLAGGWGADTLAGGDGQDVFVFWGAGSPDNADVLTDFTPGQDVLRFTSALTGMTAGPLAADSLALGSEALTALHRFVFDNGALYYDADGNGVAAKNLVATLQGVSTLSASDFVIA